MVGNFHPSILIPWLESSPWAQLGPLKWLQVTSTEPAHSLRNNYPNPLSRPDPLTFMKCPPMQGADIFQQHWPLWNANQKPFLLKYMTLSASINRPSYIIATAIIKKHLQSAHLCTRLCCWVQPKQVPECWPQEGPLTILPLQGSSAAYLTVCAPGHGPAVDHFWWLGNCLKRIN